MNFRDFKEIAAKQPLFGSDILDILFKNPGVMRTQICRWKKKGLIIVLKKGLYTIAPEEARTGLSKNLLANRLYAPSYISLETALSFYRLIPERVAQTTSVTTKKTNVFHNKFGSFIYRTVKPALFFGIREEKDEFGFKYLVADPEKALLDYLYLNLGGIDSGLLKYFFDESMRLQNRKSIDKKKLAKYSRTFAIKKIDRLLEYL